jgi:hypothetical protein
MRFDWKVDVEKRAVYDLLLDEQKESLHDRVVRTPLSLTVYFIAVFYSSFSYTCVLFLLFLYCCRRLT